MGAYREHMLEGASPVELVVALYDGILRFLALAVEAVERGDAEERRAAVKRALDIVIHLQARLRMDIGGRPAQALSEFYAAIFAQILRASQGASKEKFEHAMACVRSVRDAWRQVAREPHSLAAPLDAAARVLHPVAGEGAGEAAAVSSWTA
ncbi:MAG: flagellar export chaperone FliS [Acidobacteriota bacterium]